MYLKYFLLFFQRDGSTERPSGPGEDDVATSRENVSHLTNGNSPNRESPVSLARESEGSPRPSTNSKLSFVFIS